MCHPKPLKQSHLSLAEVDTILMPFFEHCNKDATNNDPAGITDQLSNKPSSTENSLQGDDDSWSQSLVAGGLRGEQGNIQQEASAAGPACEKPGGLHSPSTATLPQQASIRLQVDPYRKISRSSRSRMKRIRFTGIMGSFLDGESVWSDVAVMEAERREHQLGEESPVVSRRVNPSAPTPPHASVQMDSEQGNHKEGWGSLTWMEECEEGRKEHSPGHEEEFKAMDRGPARATETRNYRPDSPEV